MEPTDEMVEAAAEAHRKAWNELAMQPSTSNEKVDADAMRVALRDALAVMSDRYRAGWIAGRDAAAEEASDWDYNVLAGAIRRMEPPA